MTSHENQDISDNWKKITGIKLSEDKKTLHFAFQGEFPSKDVAVSITKDAQRFISLPGFHHTTMAWILIETEEQFDKITKNTIHTSDSIFILNNAIVFFEPHLERMGNRGVDGFDKPVVIENTIFIKKANFIGSTFANDFEVTNTLFLDDAGFNDTKFNTATFSNVVFHRETSFKSKFNDDIRFSECDFHEESSFAGSEFIGNADFSESTFYNGVDFSDSVIFHKKTSFYRSNFASQAKFFTTTFKGETSFNHSNFNHKSSFKHSVGGHAIFDESIFEYKTTFKNTYFPEWTTFTDTIFEKTIIFPDFKILAGKNSQIDFIRTYFKDTFQLQLDSNINKKTSLLLNISEASFDPKQVFINESLVVVLERDGRNSRHTYTRLKDIALTQHDNILALRLHRLEFNTHHNGLAVPLCQKIHTNNTFIKIKSIYKKLNMIQKIFLFPTLSFLLLWFVYIFPFAILFTLFITSIVIVYLLFKYKDTAKDFPIIIFEKHTSDFGTNAGKAMLWWIGVLGFFGVLVLSIGINGQAAKARPNMTDAEWIRLTPLGDGVADIFTVTNVPKKSTMEEKPFHIKNQELFAYSFNPISIITDKSILNGNKYWWLIEILNFIKTLILAILAYEITKSLRRFSRKF